MEKPQLWTKNFIINTVINFLIFLGYYLLMVIIVVYAIDHLQASPSQAGLASGIFVVAGLFSRIFSGRLIEQVGRKRFLVIGIVIFSIATLLYYIVDSLALLYVVRVLHGIGWGIATTATATIAAYIIPGERRGEGISYYSMSVTLASAIGPLIGMNLYQFASFHTILVLCTALLVVIFIATGILKVPKVDLTKEQLTSMNQLKFSNFFELKVLKIALISLVVFLSYSSIISFLSSYTKEINLVDAGSFFFMVYSISILISRPITGKLLDLQGENFVMYPSFLLFAIGLIMISQAHNSFILLLSGVFMGFGFGTYASSGQAIAIKLSAPHRMGLATSTFLAIAEMGIGMGPYFLGFIIPKVGFRGLYVGMAGLVIVAMLLYHFVYGRQVENSMHYNDFSIKSF